MPSKQGNKKKKCSGRILIYTRIATRVPPHQKRLKQTTADHLPEHNSTVLKATPSEDTTAPRTLTFPSTFLSITQPFPIPLPLRARHLHQPISLIFTFNSASRTPLIHGVGYATRSSQILNIATALTPAWTVTDGSRNHSQ